MKFFRDTLMGQQREKNELKINYHIQEWNTFMATYDILQNHSNYPTVCLLLETAHWIIRIILQNIICRRV